jgi:hypothetical protein
LLDNLYLSPPLFSEIDKYSTYVDPQIENYLKTFIHDWGRGLFPASLQISLLFSSIFLLYKRYNNYPENEKNTFGIMIMCSILVFSGTVLAFQIPWQRYIIPLVPLNIIWISYGLTPLIEFVESLFSRASTDN